jgi:diadenosine tetraphosphate (Ap4A) HIT family hydrolase
MSPVEACPFDLPRPANNEHWDLIATLSVSSLYLSTNQAYLGYCLLVFDPRHAVRLAELTPDEGLAYSRDLLLANRAIDAALRPDHVNVELLGNVVPHLHWHIVPRYRSDPRWGGPIWTTTPAEMQQFHLSPEEQRALVDRIGEALASLGHE